jgi:hypothetical protein
MGCSALKRVLISLPISLKRFANNLHEGKDGGFPGHPASGRGLPHAEVVYRDLRRRVVK